MQLDYDHHSGPRSKREPGIQRLGMKAVSEIRG
jgi:hypothetical protein